MPGFRSTSMNASPAWLADDDGNPIGTVANPIVTSGGGGGSGGVVTQPTASQLNAQVVGNVAAGTADSGNAIKIGGVANTAAPTTVANGSRADAWLTANGALVVGGFQVTNLDGQPNTNMVSLPGSQGIASARHLTVAASYFNGTTWDRVRGDTNGAYSVSKGSGTIATAQVSVGTASTQIVAARAGRGAVTITNLGTTDIYVGVTGVTTTTGTLLVGSKGASITIPTNAAVFGVAATAQSVAVLEVF